MAKNPRERPGVTCRLGLLLVAIALLVSWGAPAMAQPQPPPGPPLIIVREPQSFSRTTVFQFRGIGFAPNEIVSTVVRWPDGTDEGDVLFQANGQGIVEFIWDSKGAPPGRYQMTATGQESGISATIAFTVR